MNVNNLIKEKSSMEKSNNEFITSVLTELVHHIKCHYQGKDYPTALKKYKNKILKTPIDESVKETLVFRLTEKLFSPFIKRQLKSVKKQPKLDQEEIINEILYNENLLNITKLMYFYGVLDDQNILKVYSQVINATYNEEEKESLIHNTKLVFLKMLEYEFKNFVEKERPTYIEHAEHNFYELLASLIKGSKGTLIEQPVYSSCKVSFEKNIHTIDTL